MKEAHLGAPLLALVIGLDHRQYQENAKTVMCGIIRKPVALNRSNALSAKV